MDEADVYFAPGQSWRTLIPSGKEEGEGVLEELESTSLAEADGLLG